jgi:cysteine synthase A
MEMCRQGLLVGPSTGLTLEGLLRYLRRMKARGELNDLRNSQGRINCKLTKTRH